MSPLTRSLSYWSMWQRQRWNITISTFATSVSAVFNVTKFGALSALRQRTSPLNRSKRAGEMSGHGLESMQIQNCASVIWSAAGMQVGQENLWTIAPAVSMAEFRSLQTDIVLTWKRLRVPLVRMQI